MTISQEIFQEVDHVLLRQEELILEATERLASVMAEKEISKAELARRIGKSKSYVTQCLNGSSNLTLRTLADLFGALGYYVHIEPRMCTAQFYEQLCTVLPPSWAMHRKQGVSYGIGHEPADLPQASTLREVNWTIQ